MNRDPSHPSSKPNAFTLVELLVVIGIIVLLIGILLPAISRAMRAAHRTRIASDLNAISAALDAYKADFGDYPRIVYQDSSTYSGTFNGTGSGAETLGKALMGLGDAPDLPSDTYSPSTTYYAGNVVLQLGGQQWAALTTTTSNTPTLASKFWMPVSIPLPPSAVSPQPSGGGFDGADGPGFRLRPGGTGRVYGPYLQPDKFKTRGLAIVDYFGNPILYYPANPAKPVVTVDGTTLKVPAKFGSGNSYVGTASGITPGNVGSYSASSPCPSFYNYSDNDTIALSTADSNPSPPDFIPAFADITVMEAMLGDYSCQGYIAPGETPATTASFLLWSAGPDGQYGAFNAKVTADPVTVKNAVSKCDDVTNFTFAQ